MTLFLVDYNLTGNGERLYGTIESEGWLDIVSLRFVYFRDIGLPEETNDRAVWRIAQQHGMILLTGNRNMAGEDSLELTLREENFPDSLPVLTVSRPNDLDQTAYRIECATSLVEIVLDLDNTRGVGRLFIP